MESQSDGVSDHKNFLGNYGKVNQQKQSSLQRVVLSLSLSLAFLAMTQILKTEAVSRTLTTTLGAGHTKAERATVLIFSRSRKFLEIVAWVCSGGFGALALNDALELLKDKISGDELSGTLSALTVATDNQIHRVCSDYPDLETTELIQIAEVALDFQVPEWLSDCSALFFSGVVARRGSPSPVSQLVTVSSLSRYAPHMVYGNTDYEAKLVKMALEANPNEYGSGGLYRLFESQLLNELRVELVKRSPLYGLATLTKTEDGFKFFYSRFEELKKVKLELVNARGIVANSGESDSATTLNNSGFLNSFERMEAAAKALTPQGFNRSYPSGLKIGSDGKVVLHPYHLAVISNLVLGTVAEIDLNGKKETVPEYHTYSAIIGLFALKGHLESVEANLLTQSQIRVRRLLDYFVEKRIVGDRPAIIL